MLKKLFIILVSLNLLTHCEYKPVYSNQNNINYKINITNFKGDKYINNLLAANLKRNSKDQAAEIINVSFDTKYTKNILSKDTSGAITNYQSSVVTTFVIKKGKNSENLIISEKFNFQKMTDKYEEKNYERNVKKNIASTISQKLFLRLAVIK